MTILHIDLIELGVRLYRNLLFLTVLLYELETSDNEKHLKSNVF